MTHTEIVKKLIGRIEPAGDASRDNAYFDNLIEMCNLVNDLVTEINQVYYRNRSSHEYSVKRAADYAFDFLILTLGISE